MAQRFRIGASVVGALAFLVGCQDVQCERGRLQVESTWEEVRDTAAALKDPGDFREIDLRTKQVRHQAWSTIAQKAETVRSSFETTNITWGAADKARNELVTTYNQADPAAKQGIVARSFGNLVAKADERTGAYQAQCR